MLESTIMSGLAYLRYSASQRHVIACGSKVLADLFVCRFSARSAEKRHTLENKVPLCRRLTAPTA
jgi:hypothetical protein